VGDTLGWLEQQAAFTRSGTNGVTQVDTTGLIGAAFTHRDSRAGDPDLHTHVAISNKVAVDADGTRRWLALDGQPLHRVAVSASELYNTRLCPPTKPCPNTPQSTPTTKNNSPRLASPLD
jgi:conjugative relaxase-like TrwC/TraI family protein